MLFHLSKCIKKGLSLTLLHLFHDRELDTVATGNGDGGLVASANDEDIVEAGSVLVTGNILKMDDLERALMLLTVNDSTNTSDIVTTSDHADVTDLELDEVDDLTSLEVNLDGVVDSNGGVGGTESTTVMGGESGDTTVDEVETTNTAELELRLLVLDLVESEAALGVVEKTEVLVSLGDRDNIHESSGEGRVGTDLAVDLNVTLHEDLGDLALGESKLQAVAKHHHEGEALTELVGSGRRTRSPNAVEAAKHEVLGGSKCLEMFTGTASHV